MDFIYQNKWKAEDISFIYKVQRHCCLCSSHVLEILLHLFTEYNWIGPVRDSIKQWIEISIQKGEVQKVFEGIKRRQWKHCYLGSSGVPRLESKELEDL